MTVIEFALKMVELGIKNDEVRVIDDSDDVIYKGNLGHIVDCENLLTFTNNVVKGVSMFESARPTDGTQEYLTMISI
jgi:hypothetical protein